MSIALLLVPKHLPVGLAIGIKAITFTPLPRSFQSRSSDVSVRTTFLEYSTQVLPKLFDGWSAKKPTAVVDLENDETGFEDDYMRDHRIVLGVRVLGDVQILLNLSSRIGQKGKPNREIRFVTYVTFFGHFRCPSERLEGTAETDATAETRP
jgi:hypothetical protein